MSKGEFIVKFISESASKGKNALEAAKDEINEIDEKLHEAEKLKLRRMNLIDVLTHFGDETYKRRRIASIPSSDDIDISNSNDFKEKIIEAIRLKGKISVRDLIHEVGSYDQDALIMRTVKSLGDAEIVSRDDKGLVIPGKNFK